MCELTQATKFAAANQILSNFAMRSLHQHVLPSCYRNRSCHGARQRWDIMGIWQTRMSTSPNSQQTSGCWRNASPRTSNRYIINLTLVTHGCLGLWTQDPRVWGSKFSGPVKGKSARQTSHSMLPQSAQ